MPKFGNGWKSAGSKFNKWYAGPRAGGIRPQRYKLNGEHVAENKRADGDAREINLEEVGRLIEALEQDLARVRSGSQDVQRLRDEVETLKNVLNSPIRRHHWVRDGLHSVRQGIDEALDNALAEAMKAGQYVSEIGRILGL